MSVGWLQNAKVIFAGTLQQYHMTCLVCGATMIRKCFYMVYVRRCIVLRCFLQLVTANVLKKIINMY